MNAMKTVAIVGLVSSSIASYSSYQLRDNKFLLWAGVAIFFFTQVVKK